RCGPTTGGCSTCTATSGSGARTGTARSEGKEEMRSLKTRMILEILKVSKIKIHVCCVAARSSSVRRTYGLPFVSGVSRRSTASTAGSGRRELSPELLYGFTRYPPEADRRSKGHIILKLS